MFICLFGSPVSPAPVDWTVTLLWLYLRSFALCVEGKNNQSDIDTHPGPQEPGVRAGKAGLSLRMKCRTDLKAFLRERGGRNSNLTALSNAAPLPGPSYQEIIYFLLMSVPHQTVNSQGQR